MQIFNSICWCKPFCERVCINIAKCIFLVLSKCLSWPEESNHNHYHLDQKESRFSLESPRDGPKTPGPPFFIRLWHRIIPVWLLWSYLQASTPVCLWMHIVKLNQTKLNNRAGYAKTRAVYLSPERIHSIPNNRLDTGFVSTRELLSPCLDK